MAEFDPAIIRALQDAHERAWIRAIRTYPPMIPYAAPAGVQASPDALRKELDAIERRISSREAAHG